MTVASCSSVKNYTRQAAYEYREGKYEKALIYLRSMRRETQDPKRLAEIQFGIGECFFYQRAYFESLDAFRQHLKDCPEHKTAVFVKMYLAKTLSLLKTNTQEGEALKKEVEEFLYSVPLFLAFKECRKKSYKSIVGNVYELHEYVNRVEIYLNGEVFFKIKH